MALNGTNENNAIFRAHSVLTLILSGAFDTSAENDIISLILVRLQQPLQAAGPSELMPKDLLLFGDALAFVSIHNIPISVVHKIWSAICNVSGVLVRHQAFWRGALKFAESNSATLETSSAEVPRLYESILTCIQSPSHENRSLALKLTMLLKGGNPDAAEILRIAQSIEETPPSLDTMRFLSMQVRQLSRLYLPDALDEFMLASIPSYCFGLLRVRFASLWNDACSTLGEILATGQGEAIALRLTMEWLQTEIDGSSDESTSSQEPSPAKYEPPARGRGALDLDAAIERTLISPPAVDSQFEKDFRKTYVEAAARTSLDRPQALRLLKSVPQFAEKKARHIVPILLDQVLRNEKSEMMSSEQRWNRKDMKDLLALFASFTNPKSLYRSDEVYSALLSLLAHGDAEIQKSSLLAILTWKNESIVRFKEQLLNLFDDAQFRDQISRFLAGGDGDDSLQSDHRPHIMPIILRLLYGRAIRQSKNDQQATRRAVFDLISSFVDDESGEFLDIALGPLRDLDLVSHSVADETKLGEELLDQRRQHGLMTMLKDMLDFLGAKTSPFAKRLVDPVIYCLIRSSTEYASISSGGSGNTTSALAKSIRSSSMSCLIILFRIQTEFDWEPYLPLIFKYLISPRVENMEVETAQGVSGLLRLFATWASSDRHAQFLFTRESTLFHKIAECIGHPGTKIEVKGFVLREILIPLFRRDTAESKELIESSIHETTGHVIVQLEACLNTEAGMELVDDVVSVIVDLTSSMELSYPVLLKLAIKLIRQPARKVRSDCKMKLLTILCKDKPTTDLGYGLFEEVFEVVCSTYSRDSSSSGRGMLSKITLELAKREPGLTEISQLVDDLNSFSSAKLDAPDFELRLAAFHTITEQCSAYSCQQWKLVLANCFFYVRDTEELSIRASASHCIREFVDTTGIKTGQDLADHLHLLQDTVLESVYAGVRDQPEVVRVEYLSIVNQMVQRLPDWPPIKDLHNLLWDDEEASFFLNLLHIQQHRRVRAMHRLVEEANRGTLSKASVSNFLIPQLERFIFSSGGDSVNGVLSAEAMSAIGHLVDWLDFSQFRSLFRRYISYIRKKPEIQETIIKLLDNVSSAFVRSCKSSESPSKTTLSRTRPNADGLKTFITKELIPQLLQFVQEKDESFVSRRLLAAIVYTKAILPLPPDEFGLRFPPLLMDTCNILRSKDQSSRDQTRQTLSTICSIVGPRGLGFLLSELRRALQNGFYLHVLGYTAHAIIETNMKDLKTGDLDYCVDTVANIVMDDIFSTTGQEKDVSEYVKNNWSRREAKSKMSFDTMQLMASITSLDHLVNLVKPLESLLLEKPNHKMTRNIDELLRRIELGILQNSTLKDREVLVFCYQIIQSARKSALEDQGKAFSRSKLSNLIRFALEVVRSVLAKHKDLRTSANVEGFLPVIREAISQGQDDVKLSAIRLFTTILVVPNSQISSDATAYMKNAANIIEQSQSTTDDLSQACLKLISTILRTKADISIPEETIAGLLKKVKPDLQMVGRQGVAFNLLRSIISRKIVVPEVYELIDGEVAAIFVRDHDRATRDLARGVYIEFIMDYPQGKKRFSKQLSFLVRNLEYEYSEGRQSTMEALNLLLNKLRGDELIQQTVKDSFWPVVSIMVNDDSSDCRAMASGLVKTIISRANGDWIKGFLSLLRQLFAESSRKVQKRTALQCWKIYMEVAGDQAQDLDIVFRSIGSILAAETGDIESSWQLRYYALHAIQAIYEVFPERCVDDDSQSLWEKIIRHLLFPQSWVKLEATKLIGHLISVVLTENSTPGNHGITLTAQLMCNIMHHLLRNLRDGITEELASLTVQYLAVLGQHFAESGVMWHSKSREKPDSEESDCDAMDDDEEPQQQVTALRHLILELAGTLKRNTEPRISLVPRSAALKLITALCNNLPQTELEPCLEAIMHPLVHLIDMSVVAPATADDQFKEAYAELVAKATELMDLLQKKLGTVEFVKMLQVVKGKIAEQRDERRRKRRIEAVTQPEIVERRKMRKREKVKVKKKERITSFRSKRRGW